MVEGASVQRMARMIRDQGIEFIWDVAYGVHQSYVGDRLKLQQVLLNIIGNSIKFTEAGDVSVRCHLRLLDARRAVVQFSVCDTGIGIPADKFEKLFRPFSQVDPSNTRKFGGTGLGLAISRQLAACAFSRHCMISSSPLLKLLSREA